MSLATKEVLSLQAGDAVMVENACGATAVRTVARVAKDGRVQVGPDWFTPGQPDRYGRTVRELTGEELETHRLLERKEAALQKLSEQPPDHCLVCLLEYIAGIPTELD